MSKKLGMADEPFAFGVALIPSNVEGVFACPPFPTAFAEGMLLCRCVSRLEISGMSVN